MKNIEVNGIIIRNGHLKVLWNSDSSFGEVDILANQEDPSDDLYSDETNTFKVTTECLGEEFYNSILKSMVNYLKKQSIIID